MAVLCYSDAVVATLTMGTFAVTRNLKNPFVEAGLDYSSVAEFLKPENSMFAPGSTNFWSSFNENQMSPKAEPADAGKEMLRRIAGKVAQMNRREFGNG